MPSRKSIKLFFEQDHSESKQMLGDALADNVKNSKTTQKQRLHTLYTTPFKIED